MRFITNKDRNFIVAEGKMRKTRTQYISEMMNKGTGKGNTVVDKRER